MKFSSYSDNQPDVECEVTSVRKYFLLQIPQ